MPAASKPSNELKRLRSLTSLDVLDTPAEVQFDALVEAAALVCEARISLISLVDSERQWFKASVGLDGVSETPRDEAFCAYTIQQNDMLEVEDARADPRFMDNPLVLGEPDIRFYAGVSLRLSDGLNVGTLCVIDSKPKKLKPEQRSILARLAKAAVFSLEARKAQATERKMAQELAAVSLNLCESEARYRVLTDSSPLGIYAADSKASCTYSNTRLQEIFGLTEKEMLGNGWVHGVHPDDVDALFVTWKNYIDTGLEFNFEFRTKHKNGNIRFVHCRVKPVSERARGNTDFIGTVEDITERVEQQQEIKDAHERLAMATESGQIGVWEYITESGDFKWDDWMYRIFGLMPSGQFESYEVWVNQLHPDDRERAEQEFHDALLSHSELNMYYRIVWRDGSIRHIRATAKITRNALGTATKMVGVNWDVSALRKLTQDVAEKHELLRVTLQCIGDAVITTDAEGITDWLNPVAERMTGWTVDEAKGLPLEQVFNIVNEETRLKTENPVQTCLQQGKIVGLANHTVLIARNGNEYGIEDSAAPIRNAKGEALGVVLVFHDVTEQRRLSSEVTYQATHDALTGLINRAEFEKRMQRMLNSAHEDKSQHALLYIDLDQFKIVNDTCGHTVGDMLLQKVSQVIGQVIRARDSIARLGGDEFGVILEHCDIQQACSVATKICEKMEHFRFLHETHRFRIGTSIGLVPLDNRWSSVATLMQAADTSCYAAKEAGRNRVHTWFDSDEAIHTRHGEMQWATRIESALDENRFELFAQRIFNVSNQQGDQHVEVLLRMRDLDGTIISPAAFLPAAERFQLASRIDRWVLLNAFEWLKNRNPDDSPIDTFFVNLSGQSIGDRSFHLYTTELLKTVDKDICSKICFEITETAAITCIADASIFIDHVRALGVRVALDDFGAGASSFGYLKSLHVDILKIDGQFITGLIDDPLDDVAVRCFVDLASVIGLKTVAEFVDNPDVLKRLHVLGVDYAQGFMLHKPEPIDFAMASEFGSACGLLA